MLLKEQYTEFGEHIMKKTLLRIASQLLILTSLIFASQYLLALELDEAKQAGLVGEQADGYVGAVNKPVAEEIRGFIENINNKRKEKYQEIANKRKVDLSLVEQQSGKKLIERLKSGEFFKKKDEWEKK